MELPDDSVLQRSPDQQYADLINKQGGFAFPMGTPMTPTGLAIAGTGMSMRDFLATAAMYGLIAKGAGIDTIPTLAFQLADAMLQERGEPA